VIGPILFLLYTADLQRVVEIHRLLPGLLADNTNIYGACSPSTKVQLQDRKSTPASVDVCRRRCHLDAIKPAPIKFREYGGDAHPTGGSIKLRDLVSGLARMTSCHLHLFVISEYTSMLMFPCGRMLRRQSRVTSLFYVIVTRRLCRTNSLGLWKHDTRWTHGSVAR